VADVALAGGGFLPSGRKDPARHLQDTASKTGAKAESPKKLHPWMILRS